MPPVGQYVFAETLRILGHFTAGRQQCLPYSRFATHCNIRRTNTNSSIHCVVRFSFLPKGFLNCQFFSLLYFLLSWPQEASMSPPRVRRTVAGMPPSSKIFWNFATAALELGFRGLSST